MRQDSGNTAASAARNMSSATGNNNRFVAVNLNFCTSGRGAIVIGGVPMLTLILENW
jgi:hypothetical protein